MELIKVTEQNGEQFISSLKEIYLGAEMSKSNWSKWSKLNIEENKFFAVNQDYQSFVQETNGNETKDYACTLEMAKHLVMQMPTDKAHEYRSYLIQLEKAWNTPEQIMARALKIAQHQIDTYKEKIDFQQKEIEHKEDVIIGLVEDIDLSTKRQRITQIIRHRAGNYQARYQLLYKEFEKKYHCDLDARLSSYNYKNKPMLKNKMDYIDKVMEKIPQLYELTCKLFEGDVNTLKKEWFDIIENKI